MANVHQVTIAQDTVPTPLASGDHPYPLRRRFLTIVLPLLLVALAGLLFTVAQALSLSVERTYQAEASGLHAMLGAVAKAEDLGTWDTALSGTFHGRSSPMSAVLASEGKELSLGCILLLDGSGATVAGANEQKCPTIARVDLVAAAENGSSFREEDGPPSLWTVITKVASAKAGHSLFVLTAQPAGARESRLGVQTLAWIGGLALGLLGALGFGTVFVLRAQTDIDARTAALREARSALASYVSANTRRRAGGATGARSIEATVLFLDIRDFSSFAEDSTAREAADLVSQVAGIAFRSIAAHGGDVDRLLGDGAIAWFEGDDRRANAMRAAGEMLRLLRDADLPRGVGVGVHDGPVVEAEIGAGDRKDATVLGRTVNLASRLCAAAAAGELVASLRMEDPENGSDLELSATERLDLKGLRDGVDVRRFKLRPK